MFSTSLRVKALPLLLCFFCLFQSQASYMPFAHTRIPQSYTMANASYLRQSEANAVVSHIQDYWAQAYPHHQFTLSHVQFHNETFLESGQYQVDVTIHASATLTTAPQDHPYLQGMTAQLMSLPSEEIALVSATVARYETNLAQSYLQSQDLVASYRLVYDADPSANTNTLPQPTYYFGQRYTNEKSRMLLPSAYSHSAEAQKLQGQNALTQLVKELSPLPPLNTSAVYLPKAAITYANAFALEVPEYNAENRMGNDCANFVSFCLMTGGIPADVEGDWYPSQSPGTYGGLNWIRTGFIPTSGGVTVYTTEKNYFFPSASEILVPPGGIVFYQDDSHMGLVTYHDGDLMLYSYRSNVTQEYQNHLHEGNFADYYSPNPALIPN